MGKGNILIQLSTAQDALPVTSAKVKITDSTTKEVVYESEQSVDQSGKSGVIPVSTPDKSESLEPLPKDIIPYARYDISVEASGYERVTVEGVSVFDGTTSIQYLSLNEKEEGEAQPFFNPSENRIVIPPNQLLLNINRDQKTGTLFQPFVLREVYIPEYITVHLGTPTSSAQNVTVRFVDYIKNVASHEIYATWPEESLKANIYAQITFALNRVYTEWYRNKGYSFQITNSTAYDQYYVRGGNVFENISKIVDGIFNEYFSLVNSVAPYFTQYCNGTTSKCKGLSQWGTVDLAKQGKKALEILQYYYGTDKILKRTPVIAGLVESYPGSALRVGSRNSNVTIIQQQLNRVSRNYPAIPKVNPVDGIFGRQTENSVKTFQRVFNLVVDGIVGRATWYKLSAIYTAVTKLGELDQEPVSSIYIDDLKYADFNGVPPKTPIEFGEASSKVKEFQYYLREVSDAYGLKINPINGIYDKDTKETILEFIKEFKLPKDEKIDSKLFKSVYDVYFNLDRVYSVEDLTNYPGYVLRKGISNRDVRRLQTMLLKISEKYKEIPEINVDGIYEGRTQNVVLRFQEVFGLNKTGRVDINTWRNIVLVYLNLDSGRNINTSNILLPFPGEDLKLGDDNAFVSVLKEYMNVLSKNGFKIRILDTDNLFDKATKENVLILQKNFALPQTGVVDKKTWEKIAETYEGFFTGRNI